MRRFQRLAMVARWKPFHLGQQRVVEGLLQACDTLTLGIGSANRYDRDNPLTAQETEAMLRRVVPSQVRILAIPDLDNPPRWAAHLAGQLGPLDAFVTANPWVENCMRDYYVILHPVQFVPPHLRIALEARMIRQAWLKGEAWEHWVSPPVLEFLRDIGAQERYVREFCG